MNARINRIREKAFSLQDAGALRESYEFFQDLMRLAPDEIESARRAAEVSRDLGYIDDAIKYFQMAAEHYLADGLFLKAVSICKEIQAVSPKNADTAKMLQRLHDLQKAERKLKPSIPVPGSRTTAPKVSLQSILKRPSGPPPPNSAGALPTTPLFSNLPKSAFVGFVEDMQMRHLQKGDVIIREGETGNSFFVIVSGRVRVEKRIGTKRTTLAFLTDGAFFGEMALMHKAPRTASVVVASESCKFFEFDQTMLKRSSDKYPSVKRIMRNFCEDRLLSTTMAVHPLFKAFHIAVRRELMSLFKSRTFKAADILIEEGKPSKGLYLVLSGRLEVLSTKNDERVVLARLNPGDMFGEMSILSKEPAAATIQAVGETRVLRLPAASFMKVANVYPEVLDLLDSLAHERRSANQIRLSFPPPIF